MAHIVQFLVRHGYALVFFWILAEQGAVPLPSIPLLLACGALARGGRLNLFAILLCGLAACLIADNTWFQLGRLRGGRILRLLCRISLEPDSCVRQTEDAYLKYGLRSLLVSKFIPGLNAVAAPLAGVSRASRARFCAYDTLGALLWIATYTGLGFLFSDQLEAVAEHALRLGSALTAIVLGAVAAWFTWKLVLRRRFLRKLSVARITVQELREQLDAGAPVVIVDLRSHVDPNEPAIPGALRISPADLAERHHEIPRDRDIVLFCS